MSLHGDIHKVLSISNVDIIKITNLHFRKRRRKRRREERWRGGGRRGSGKWRRRGGGGVIKIYRTSVVVTSMLLSHPWQLPWERHQPAPSAAAEPRRQQKEEASWAWPLDPMQSTTAQAPNSRSRVWSDLLHPIIASAIQSIQEEELSHNAYVLSPTCQIEIQRKLFEEGMPEHLERQD